MGFLQQVILSLTTKEFNAYHREEHQAESKMEILPLASTKWLLTLGKSPSFSES